LRTILSVFVGHPHEGSSYPSQKVLQSAWHRLEHVKTRISELERLRLQAGLTPAQKQQIAQQQAAKLLQQQQQQQQQQQTTEVTQ
jgi:hypothetical protein